MSFKLAFFKARSKNRATALANSTKFGSAVAPRQSRQIQKTKPTVHLAVSPHSKWQRETLAKIASLPCLRQF